MLLYHCSTEDLCFLLLSPIVFLCNSVLLYLFHSWLRCDCHINSLKNHGWYILLVRRWWNFENEQIFLYSVPYGTVPEFQNIWNNDDDYDYDDNVIIVIITYTLSLSLSLSLVLWKIFFKNKVTFFHYSYGKWAIMSEFFVSLSDRRIVNLRKL